MLAHTRPQLERLQPSLLDRLTDDEPTERADAFHKRFSNAKQLRESVVRDLGWLLNSVRMSTVQDLAAYPYAAKSVLNYGLPDLAGRTASSIDAAALQEQLRQVLVDFEPRLLPESVSVLFSGSDASHNSMQLTIEAELFAYPAPLSLCLRTEIDLENGEVNILDLNHAQRGAAADGP